MILAIKNGSFRTRLVWYGSNVVYIESSQHHALHADAHARAAHLSGT